MILTADSAGERLDAFLSRGSGLTRSAAQKLIEQGQVTLNGRPGKKNDRLNPGDRVEFSVPEAKPVDIPARDIPLDIDRSVELNSIVPALERFEAIDPALVPEKSLLREFIGGSSYHYG